MWTREELKLRGKQAFKRNYWSAVLVALVMAVVTGAFGQLGSQTGSQNGNQTSLDSFVFGGNNTQVIALTTFALAAAAIFAIAAVVILVLKIVIGNALLVGGYRFFITNQTETPTAGLLAYGFKSGNLGNIILTMFLRDLYIVLWSFLFIIPGIVKSYEYLMVPYILAENPGMDRKEAFLISKQMMMGQKWNVFVLDMSFLGWRILEAITFGIVGVFYVEPYYQATMAELYAANRAMAYQNGFIR